MKSSGLFVLILLLTLASACSKKKDPYYIDPLKLKGYWIGIGTGNSTGSIAPPDAFAAFDISAVTDSFIVVDQHILRRQASQPGVFIDDQSYGMHPNYTKVQYNYADGSVVYSTQGSGSYGGASVVLSTAGYKADPSVKQYVQTLTGTRSLAGNCSDVFYYYNNTMNTTPRDSASSFSAAIVFNRVNDSTLSFHYPQNQYTDTLLHYKYTDHAAKTVTFQSFHTTDFRITTLTYNIQSNTIVFEQQFSESWKQQYLKLQ